MPDKKTGTEVTDPALLAQLNAGDNTSSQKQEVTDPALLAQLNGDQTTPQKKSPSESVSASSSPDSQTGVSGSDQNAAENNWETPHATVPGIQQTGITVGDTNVAPQAKSALGIKTIQPKTLPFTNIPVDKPLKTSDEVKQETADKATGFAQAILQNASSLPLEHQQNISSVPFSDPGSVLNNATDIHGDPSTAGAYYQSILAKLKQSEQAEIAQLNSNPNDISPNAYLDVHDKYDQQIQKLSEDAGHIVKLQIFNKEYTTKPLTDAAATTQIDALTKQHEQDVKNALKGTYVPDAYFNSDRNQAVREQKVADLNRQYQTQVSQVNSLKKYDPIRMGAEYAATLGDKQAQQDLQQLNQGKQIDPQRQYLYNVKGREVMIAGNQNAEANNATSAVEETIPHLDLTGKKLIDNNKPYLVSQAAQAVGNEAYKNKNKLQAAIYGIVPSQVRPNLTSDEIDKYAKSAGLPDELTDALKEDPNQIPKTASVPQKFVQGMFDAASPASSFLYKNVAYPLLGGKDFEETHAPGWEQTTGVSPLIAGNTPSLQNGWSDATSIIGHMAQTAGSLSTLGSGVGNVEKGFEAAGLAAPAAKKAAEFGVFSAMGYNDAYGLSKDVIGDKPEDEWKRQLFSVVSGLTNGALLSAAGAPTELIEKGLATEGKTGETLLKELKKADSPDFLQTPSGVQAVQNIVLSTAKETGKQMGLMTSAKIAQNIINKISNPERDQDITEGAPETLGETAITMLIPSLFGAAGHQMAQTPLNAAASFDIGSNPEKYSALLKDQLAQGEINPQQHAQGQQFVQTMGKIVANTPTVNDDGKKLTPDQIKSYAWSSLQENILQNKIESLTKGAEITGLPLDKAQVDPLKAKISQIEKQKADIYKNAGAPTTIPTPQVQGALARNAQAANGDNPESTNDITKEIQADYFKRNAIKGKLDEGDQFQHNDIGEDTEDYINWQLNYYKPDEASTKYRIQQYKKWEALKNRYTAAKQAEATRNAQGSVATDDETTPAAGNQNISTENLDNNTEPVSLTPQDQSQTKITGHENENGESNRRKDGAENSWQSQDQRGNSEVQGDTEDGRVQGQEKSLASQKPEDNKAGATTPALSVSEKLAALKKKKLVASEDQQAPPITEHPEYKAMNLGTENGKDADERKQIINNTPNDQKIGGGESFNEFADRIKSAWENTKKTAKDQTAMIAHSGVMRMLEAAQEHGWDDRDALREAYNNNEEPQPGERRTYKTDNGEIHIIRHPESQDGKDGKLRRVNTPLTPEGEQQAAGIAADLKKDDIAPPEIQVAPEPRTAKAGEIVQEELATPEEVQKGSDTKELKDAIDHTKKGGTSNDELNDALRKANDLRDKAKKLENSQNIDDQVERQNLKDKADKIQNEAILNIPPFEKVVDNTDEMLNLKSKKFNETKCRELSKKHQEKYGGKYEEVEVKNPDGTKVKHAVVVHDDYVYEPQSDALIKKGVFDDYFSTDISKEQPKETPKPNGAIATEPAKEQKSPTPKPKPKEKTLTKEQQKVSDDAKLKYNIARKTPSKQGNMIRTATKRIEVLKERIDKFSKGSTTYKEAVNELAIKQDFIDHTKQYPPKEVGKGYDVKDHMARVARVMKEARNSESVEEDVMAAMLKMHDHHPETKWNTSSLGNKAVFKANAKPSEKTSARNYTNDEGKISIDKWASGMSDDPEKHGAYKEEAERLIREHPSKVDLAKSLEKIQQDRIKAAEDPREAQMKEEWEKQQAREMNEAQAHAGVSDEEIANKDINEPVVADGQDDIQKIDEADLSDDDKQKIEGYYRKYYNEKTKEVNYDRAHMDYPALQSLKESLSDKGKALMDDIVPFDNFEQHNKQVQELIKNAAEYEKQQREAGIAQEGEPEREITPEGRSAPPDVQDQAANEASNPAGDSEAKLKELSVAQRQHAEFDQQLKDKDLELQKERALLQNHIAKGKEAEQKLKIAKKADDKEAVGNLTDVVNNRKDLALKHEANIERLERERSDIEEDQKRKDYWNDLADKVEKKYKDNRDNHEGEALGTPTGLSTKIGDHVMDFLMARAVEGIRNLGNLEVAIRRAIRLTKEKFGDEAKGLSDEDAEGLRSQLASLEKPPKEEPSLPSDHEAWAKDIIDLMRTSDITHEEAKQIVHEHEFTNREGEPVSDHVAENNKAAILNYIDWHNQKDLTSIKNASTRILRKQVGLTDEVASAKKEFGETWDETKGKIENGEIDPRDLVEALSRKARPLNDVENATLLHYNITQKNKLKEFNEKINKSAEQGDQSAVNEYQISKMRVIDELQKIVGVTKATGAENGRGLATRKMLANDQYELQNMIYEKSASANDGESLNADQLAHIEKLNKHIEETQKAADDYKKQKEAEMQQKEAEFDKKVI